MNLWVGRVLPIFSVVLMTIAVLSASNQPVIESVATKTYSTTEFRVKQDVITSSVYVTLVKEVSSSHLTSLSSAVYTQVTLKKVYLPLEFKGDYVRVWPLEERLDGLKANDLVVVSLRRPAHIQIFDVSGKVAEIYGGTELHHTVRFDCDHVVTIELEDSRLDLNELPQRILVIIGVTRPEPGSFEIVVETAKGIYSYTTTSVDVRYLTQARVEARPLLVEDVSIEKQPLLPPWVAFPILVIAIVIVLVGILLRRRPSIRPIDHLGVLLLEDRYYRREELIGKLVYNSKAMRVGEVIDVGYSKDGKVALVARIDKGREKVISFTQIEEIGDIILLSPESEKERESRDFRILRTRQSRRQARYSHLRDEDAEPAT